MPSYSDFIAEFPEFDGYTPATEALVTRCLTNAAAQCNATVWGDMRDQGVLHLAAHMVLQRSQSLGTPGVIVAEKLRNRSVNYAVVAGGDPLASTAYGAEYLRLRGMLDTTPIVV